jgi:outer membrane protein
MRQSILLTILLMGLFKVEAQEKWNLKNCVEYAMANNITVRQGSVLTKQADLTLNQTKLSRWPSLFLNNSNSFNSGLSQDPTTFNRVTENYFASGFQLQSSADIFNFFSKRNTIAANEWDVLAAKANVDKTKNDIALSTANAYLQALLAKEQQNIASVQLQQTTAQLNNTRKLVDAGNLPELNATQLEAQQASDSGNYINARGNYVQALLSLKSLMNLDAGKDFDIENPSIASIPLDPIAELQPELVYQEALKNQPLQRSNVYKLKAAEKYKAAARASMYPTISAFGNLNTNYLTFINKPIYESLLQGYVPTSLVTDVNGSLYDVKSPIFTNGNRIGYQKYPGFRSQLSDNFGKSFGIAISVPIFNGYTLRTQYEKSKLNIESAQLQQELDNMNLKQDIFQAYNAALIALEKFNAGKKSVEANEKALLYATKRYDIGSLSTLELITTQNNLLRAKLEYSINQYDYVFKMKVLEFYKGAGLKL